MQIKINAISESENRTFFNIQKIRSNNYNRRSASSKPFSAHGNKKDYAFHSGGRKELQFNIGEETINGRVIFRYGVAFSLYEDRTLHNSKAEFRKQIYRFNKFVLENADFFWGFNMWYHAKHEMQDFFEDVRIIGEELFKAEHFIFIGKHFQKNTRQLNEEDVHEIINPF